MKDGAAIKPRPVMPQPGIAKQLEQIASDIHSIAFDFTEPARSLRDAEDRIARVEDLAERLRATVRGRG